MGSSETYKEEVKKDTNIKFSNTPKNIISGSE